MSPKRKPTAPASITTGKRSKASAAPAGGQPPSPLPVVASPLVADMDDVLQMTRAHAARLRPGADALAERDKLERERDIADAKWRAADLAVRQGTAHANSFDAYTRACESVQHIRRAAPRVDSVHVCETKSHLFYECTIAEADACWHVLVRTTTAPDDAKRNKRAEFFVHIRCGIRYIARFPFAHCSLAVESAQSGGGGCELVAALCPDRATHTFHEPGVALFRRVFGLSDAEPAGELLRALLSLTQIDRSTAPRSDSRQFQLLPAVEVPFDRMAAFRAAVNERNATTGLGREWLCRDMQSIVCDYIGVNTNEFTRAMGACDVRESDDASGTVKQLTALRDFSQVIRDFPGLPPLHVRLIDCRSRTTFEFEVTTICNPKPTDPAVLSSAADQPPVRGVTLHIGLNDGNPVFQSIDIGSAGWDMSICRTIRYSDPAFAADPTAVLDRHAKDPTATAARYPMMWRRLAQRKHDIDASNFEEVWTYACSQWGIDPCVLSFAAWNDLVCQLVLAVIPPDARESQRPDVARVLGGCQR